MELNKTLLESLKDVRRAVHKYLSTGEKPKWFDPKLGICAAVIRSESSPKLRSGFLTLLIDLMEEWPEFSGYRLNPVPHPSERPDKAFYLASAEEMWSPVSAYGAARLRLLDWLIARLEAEIEAETEAETTKETQNDHP